MTQSKFIFDDKERVGAWVAERVGHPTNWGAFYAMGAEVNGELVAGFVVNNFTDANAIVHLAISRPTKLLHELFDHAFVYAFQTCRLLRLTALVDVENEKSLRIVERVGFRPEAVMAQAGSAGQDRVVLVLWPQNYRKGRVRWEKRAATHPTTMH